MEVRRELCRSPGRHSAESRQCTTLVVQSRVDAGLILKGTCEVRDLFIGYFTLQFRLTSHRSHEGRKEGGSSNRSSPGSSDSASQILVGPSCVTALAAVHSTTCLIRESAD